MKIRFFVLPFTLFATTSIPVATVSSCSNSSVLTQSVVLSLSKTTSDVGDEIKLTTKVLPENASKDLDITISNSSDFYKKGSDIIIPYKAGTYTITAKAKDGSGKSDTKTLNVIEETTTESWIDYANDRTFSLKLTSGGKGCYGTGWILSDATPTVLNDYQYYVATNWHVANGLSTNNVSFSIGCGEENSPLTSDNFIKIDGQMMEEDNFLHGDTIDVRIEGEVINALQCIDLYVLKLDFKKAMDTASTYAAPIKTKINKLNVLTSNGKKITKIAPITTKDIHYEDTASFYTLGYPADGRPGPTREQHSFDAESIILNFDKNNGLHLIPNKSIKYNKYLVDCAPQYTSLTSVSPSWMNGGASGSMLLGDFGPDSSHHIYKVCGIYWGIFTDYTQPSYSIFNSEYKNFVSNFY